MLVALPDELSLRIVAALPVPDRCRLARVCRAFARLTLDATLWRRTATLVAGAGDVPKPRVCHSSALYKGRVFVYGGHNPAPGSNYISDVKNDLYVYDLGPCLPDSRRSCPLIYHSVLHMDGASEQLPHASPHGALWRCC